MNQSKTINALKDAFVAAGQFPCICPIEDAQEGDVEGVVGQNRVCKNHHILLQLLGHQQRLDLSNHLGLGLAHQINHPLSASVNYIQGCIKMLQDEDFNRNELLSLMSRASEESYRASELIRRLRRFVSQPAMRLSTMNFNYAVLETVALLGPLFKEHQIDLQMNLTEELPQIVGDRIQLEQMVFNLVLNAIECFGDNPEVPAVIDLTTEPGEGNTTVILSVKDNGPGCSDVSVETLFKAFYTTKPDNLGLGLSMSQAICKAHRGSVTLFTQDTVGSCATAVLPVTQVDESIEPYSDPHRHKPPVTSL